MTSQEREPLRPLSPSQKASLEAATRDYEKALREDITGAFQTLFDRGLTLPTIDTFRLGVVDEPHPGHARVRGWLSIPYLDKNSYPLALRFRRPAYLTDGPKYQSLEGDPARLFNVRALFEAGDTLDVAEGEFDAMILEQCGFHAVALPGASMWNGAFRRLLSGFSKVRVWADADEAGAKMAQRLYRSLPAAQVMRIPNGMDVTDVYLHGGASAIKEIAGA